MKQHMFKRSSILIFLLVTILFAQNTDRKIWISSLIGDVKIRRNSSVKWIPARPNMRLKVKDAVRTFVESETVIRTTDGTAITLGENATFEVSQLSGSSSGFSETSVKILTGSLVANVKKLTGAKSRFEFETPTAVAAIRGTKLGIEVSDAKTAVKVYEGVVIVTPHGASKGIAVKKNQMTTVAKGQKDAKISKMKSSDIDTTGLKNIDTIAVAPIDTIISLDTTKIDTVSTKKVDNFLTVNKPTNGVKIYKPLISIVGKSAPGAEVSVGGSSAIASATGDFKFDVPIADEEGTVTLEIESILGTKKITKIVAVIYEIAKEDISLEILSPVKNEIICSGIVDISARVRPAKATVSLNGKPLNNSSGQVTGRLQLSEGDETADLEFEVETEYGTKTYNSQVTYTPTGKDCNVEVPSVQPTTLPDISKIKTLYFSVYDKTITDEVTFKYSIDGGSEENEQGINGTRFPVDLEEGTHNYKVYAVDLAGNRSNEVVGDVTYLIKPPVILLDSPSSAFKVIHIPPSAPKRDFSPVFTISFSVENLPDDNGDLLKEVSVSNAGAVKTKNKFYKENDFDFDIKLNRGINNILIKVRDLTDRIVEKSVTIEIK